MMLMLSLLLNVAVLVPVCGGIIADAGWARAAYGPRSAARGILLSIYLAIGGMSVALLYLGSVPMAAALLLVQVAYKLTTPLTVPEALKNPVVLSNLAIAAFHAATLWTLWPALQQG